MQPPWERRRRWRVGMLVVGSVALFFSLLIFVVGVSFGSRHDEYYILLDESAKGLVVGSTVNFQGVPVGSVQDIRFQNGKTRVEISFDPTRAVIQANTVARLDRAFVTGAVTIELEGYETGTDRLPSGSTIGTAPSPLDEFTSVLPEVATDLRLLVADVRTLVGNLNGVMGPENQGHIAGILANLEQATRDLGPRADGTLSELQALVGDARRAVTSLDRTLVSVNDADVGATVREAREAIVRLSQLEGRADDLLIELRGVLGSARSPLLEVLATASDTMAQVRVLARRLSQAPSSLIFGNPSAELAIPGSPGKD